MPKPASKPAGLTIAQFAFFGLTSAILLWVLLDEIGVLQLFPELRGHRWLLAAVAGGGALVGITRASRLLHSLTGAIVALWLTVCLSPLAGRLVSSLKTGAAPAPADAVVVLASSVRPDNGLSEEALARLVRGLEMLQGKFAPRLVLTETGPPGGSYTAAAHEVMAGLRISYPIDTVTPVRNTHDEAVLVSRLARDRHWKRILLVTSPVHCRRALLTFRKAGVDAIPIPSAETRYYLDHPSSPHDRLRAFADALHEIVGLRIYRLRGWAE